MGHPQVPWTGVWLGRRPTGGLAAPHLLGATHWGRGPVNTFLDPAPNRLQPTASVGSAIAPGAACSANHARRAAGGGTSATAHGRPCITPAGTRRTRRALPLLDVLGQAAPVTERVFVRDVDSHSRVDWAGGQLGKSLGHCTTRNGPTDGSTRAAARGPHRPLAVGRSDSSPPTAPRATGAIAHTPPPGRGLVEDRGHLDAGPWRLPSAGQLPTPGVLAPGYALQRLRPSWGGSRARAHELPCTPIAPRSATGAKGERGISSHHGDDMPFVCPHLGAFVSNVPTAPLRPLLCGEGLPPRPGAAALAAPRALAEGPIVLLLAPRVVHVGRLLPPAEAVLFRGREHSQRHPHSPGDQRSSFEVELELGPLVVRWLRVEADRLPRQGVGHRVAADVPERISIHPVSLRPMRLDPADARSTADVVRAAILVHQYARVHPPRPQRLARGGIGRSDHVGAVRPHVGRPRRHAAGERHAQVLARL